MKIFRRKTKKSQKKDSKVTEKKSYDSLQSQKGTHSQVIAGSQRLLTKLEKLGDTCPTCEQKVDPDFTKALIGLEKRKISDSEKQIEQISESIELIKDENKEFEHSQRIESDWKELWQSIDRDMPTTPLDKQELESRLESVRGDLLTSKSALESTAKENERRTKHNTRIQVIEEQTDAFLKELDEFQGVLDKQESLLSNLEILKKAFSTNGLLAYKIENLVKELEELANTYLAELSDGRFTLEFVVSNDKLNVQVEDDGKIVDILALSSGELARVNTAT